MSNALPYLTAKSPEISSVWDNVPTRFLFCRWRGCIARRIQAQTVDRVDPSPRDPPSNARAAKRALVKLIERLTSRHVASREAPDRHQIKGLEMIAIRRPRSFAIRGTTRSSNTNRTAAIVRNHGDARGAILIGGSSSDRRDLARWEHRVDHDLIIIGRFRSFVEELHDRGPIEPRSRRDRAATGEFTWWNRHQSSGRSTNDQDHDRGPIVTRSWPNRGPIVARSRLKCMIFEGEIEADLLWNWSHDTRPRNRPLDTIKPPPRSPPLPTISSPISPLKACISPLLFFNFWSIREGIKRILRNISSSSWSPRVYTRLRSNWCGIDREFLLDFIEFSPWIPNVHEEESKQIRFNPRELEPHLCSNRVSSEIRSIIRR